MLAAAKAEVVAGRLTKSSPDVGWTVATRARGTNVWRCRVLAAAAGARRASCQPPKAGVRVNKQATAAPARIALYLLMGPPRKPRRSAGRCRHATWRTARARPAAWSA